MSAHASACASPSSRLVGLPDEVIGHVLDFLDGPDLARCSQLCRKMRAVIARSALWRAACMRRGWRLLANDMQALSAPSADEEAISYQRAFVARWQTERNFSAGTYVQTKLQRVSAALSIDVSGQFIAAGKRDGAISLLLLDSGAPVGTLHGHSDWVRGVSLSPQWLVSGSSDTTLRVWSLGPAGAAFLEALSGHTDSVTTVKLLGGPEPLLASGSADGTVRVWDLRAKPRCVRVLEVPPPARPPPAGRGAGRATLGRCATWGGWLGPGPGPGRAGRGWCRAARTASSTCGMRAPAPPCAPSGSRPRPRPTRRPGRLGTTCGASAPSAPAASPSAPWCGPRGAGGAPDGRQYQHGVSLWDVEAGGLEGEMRGHTDLVMGLGVADGRLLLSASQDGTLRVWDLDAGACERVWQAEGVLRHSVNCLVVAGTAGLALGTDAGAFLWSFAPPPLPLSALC